MSKKVRKDFTNFRHHKRYGSKLIYVDNNVCPSLHLDGSMPTSNHQKTHKKIERKRQTESDSENDQSRLERFHFVDVDENVDDVKPQQSIFDSEGCDSGRQDQEEVLIKDEPSEIDVKDDMWPMMMLESHLEPEENYMEDRPSLISLTDGHLWNIQPKEEETGEGDEETCRNCKCRSAPTSIKDVIDFDDPYKKAVMHFDKSQRQMSTLQVIQMSPKFYLGVPIQSMHILKSVSAQEKIFPLDLLITLTKIRLNDPFMRLSIDFGVAEARCRDIFRQTVPKAARALASFISWSGHGEPPVFFVDIFSLQAEAKHQTGGPKEKEPPEAGAMKVLVCHDRAGAVSYVSGLFPAEMADIEVLAYSELLNSVPAWAQLFLHTHLDLTRERTAEGLFYLDRYMEKNGVEGTSKAAFSDVMYVSVESRMGGLAKGEEKKIVGVVDRLGEFGMLKRHSKVPRDMLLVLPDIVKIVCGLINTEHLSESS